MPPIESPARRVLGDKTTNAPIRKQSPLKATKHSHAHEGGLQTHSTVGGSGSSRAGLKRSIDDVEDAERIDSDDSQRSTGTQVLSLLSDSDEDSGVYGSKSSNVIGNAASMSFRQPQHDATPMETTFEIMEEDLSQNTRENLVSSVE